MIQTKINHHLRMWRNETGESHKEKKNEIIKSSFHIHIQSKLITSSTSNNNIVSFFMMFHQRQSKYVAEIHSRSESREHLKNYFRFIFMEFYSLLAVK